MTSRKRGHGEGGSHQRSDGRWEGRLDLPDGKHKSVYGKTRREVLDKLCTSQRSLDDGIDLSVGRITVAQYLDRWLSASVKPSVKTKTYEGYESIARVRVVPRIGRKSLAKVAPLDIQTFYTDLQGAGLSGRSIRHTHQVLHRAFTQAMRWGILVRNPCDLVTLPRPLRKEIRVSNQDQATALLDATREHQSQALYMLALTTGMRQGELLGLKWEDIDLDAGRLHVRRALQRQKEAGLVLIQPETAGSSRTIVLSKRAVTALRRHGDRQAFARRTASEEWTDHDLVFANATGGFLDPSHQTAVFNGVLRKEGLPPIRFHDLRHTAATLLLAQQVHPKVVSEMLGHSTITLTLDTYSHLVPVLHEQAAAAMDAMLGA